MIDLDKDLIERRTVVSPFGLLLWDQVTQKTIGDGFKISAYPLNREDRRVFAFKCLSDAYGFRGLPGMREVEMGTGDRDFWDNVPSRSFVVEIEDQQERFLPFSFEVTLPRRNAFNWEGSELLPLEAPLGVPLFSTPGRRPPASVAVLRAYLMDPGLADRDNPKGKGAAWAVVRARVGDQTIRGVADRNGQLLMMFPYPRPSIDLSDSPPLRDQTWTVEIDAVYQRKESLPTLPDLSEILDQPAAFLWSDEARTIELPAQKLKYGQELVLRSADSGGRALSELFITSVD